MTVAETEWDESQRAWMQALTEYEDGLCDGCGRPLSETTAPGAEDAYPVPGPPDRCHACTALAHAATRDSENPHPHALRYQVIDKRMEGRP